MGMKLKYGSNSGRAPLNLNTYPPSRLVLPALFVLWLGCMTPEDTPNTRPSSEPRNDTTAADASLWSRESLEAQPRMASLQRQTSTDLGYVPGTTSWRRADIDVSRGGEEPASERADSPDALLTRVTPILRGAGEVGGDVWERTTRIWQEQENEAVAVVLHWGLKDDALAGHDYRVTMRRNGQGWHIDRIDERFHCRRLVTEDGLCV